jgi:hypothetical protein
VRELSLRRGSLEGRRNGEVGWCFGGVSFDAWELVGELCYDGGKGKGEVKSFMFFLFLV